MDNYNPNQDFVTPPQPRNGEFIIPTTYEDLYVQMKSIFIIIGVPYEQKSERQGADLAYTKIKDHLFKLEEYQLSESLQKGELCILDLGQMPPDLDNYPEIFERYILAILEIIPQARLILFGGDRAIVEYLMNIKEDAQLVNIDSCPQLKQDQIVEGRDVINFGVSGGLNPVIPNNAKNVFLKRDIRRYHQQHEYLQTQAASILHSYLQDRDVVMVLHCESVNSAYLLGQSKPMVVGGLNTQEVIEIVGLTKKIQVLYICGFNPAVESLRSGTFLSSLVFSFIQQQI